MVTMTCEKDVKLAVKKLFKAHGVWYFMPVQTGYARKGIPDFIACIRGQFLAVETKFGRNKPSPHQRRELADIGESGGTALVISERNLDVLGVWLDRRTRIGSP